MQGGKTEQTQGTVTQALNLVTGGQHSWGKTTKIPEKDKLFTTL